MCTPFTAITTQFVFESRLVVIRQVGRVIQHTALKLCPCLSEERAPYFQFHVIGFVWTKLKWRVGDPLERGWIRFILIVFRVFVFLFCASLYVLPSALFSCHCRVNMILDSHGFRSTEKSISKDSQQHNDRFVLIISSFWKNVFLFISIFCVLPSALFSYRCGLLTWCWSAMGQNKMPRNQQFPKLQNSTVRLPSAKPPKNAMMSSRNLSSRNLSTRNLTHQSNMMEEDIQQKFRQACISNDVER